MKARVAEAARDGKVLRCPVGGISSMGRATQGVRVMNLDADEKLVSIARLAEEDVSGEALESGEAAAEAAEEEAVPVAPGETQDDDSTDADAGDEPGASDASGDEPEES